MKTKEITNEEARKVLALYLKLQSVIHSIDDLHDTTLMKQEFKRRTNGYLRFIEKHVNGINSNMDLEEAENYVLIVKELDKITNELVVTT